MFREKPSRDMLRVRDRAYNGTCNCFCIWLFITTLHNIWKLLSGLYGRNGPNNTLYGISPNIQMATWIVSCLRNGYRNSFSIRHTDIFGLYGRNGPNNTLYGISPNIQVATWIVSCLRNGYRNSFFIRHTVRHNHYYWFWMVMGLIWILTWSIFW